MGMKKAQFIIKGMNRDISVSKFSPDYAYENLNLRLLATNSNDSLSLVNEKGNKKATINWKDATTGDTIVGTPIGQQILGDKLVLFTTGKKDLIIKDVSGTHEINNTVVPTGTDASVNITYDTSDGYDYIYKFWFENSGELCGKKLFGGSLNFSTENSIDSISIYENEQLQKVYWVDGKNMPRVINIEGNSSAWTTDDSFDFIRKLSFTENIKIEKEYTASGVFAPGTIQYCFTYFDLYGQQTNIFHISPLYYISYEERGANPTDTISNAFKITLEDLDTKFDYVRVYSILRTSINATPQVKVVANLAVGSSKLTYIDNGTTGYSIDPTELLYVGGKGIVANTISQKDNTLFLGNITTSQVAIPEWIKESMLANSSWLNSVVVSNNESSDSVSFDNNSGTTSFYAYGNQLRYNSQEISTFKHQEYYRLGVQFQDTLGNWSEVCYIGDKLIPYSSYVSYDNSNKITLHPVRMRLSIGSPADSTITSTLLEMGFVRVRPVIVYPSLSERAVICQGVVNPTVFNVEDRYNNAPFAQASWFFRPNSPIDIVTGSAEAAIAQTANNGKWAEFRHFRPIPGNRELNSEIQCISLPPSSPHVGGNTYNSVPSSVVPEGFGVASYTENSNPIIWVSENKECYYIDQSIVTLNSPDIEFNKEIQGLNLSDLKFRIVGAIKLTSFVSDIDIQTSTPPLCYSWGEKQYADVAPGFYKEPITNKFSDSSVHGWKSMLSGIFWLDEFYKSKEDNKAEKNVGFAIYPWHRNGSLNNTRQVPEEETKSALLKKKKMSILRFSADTQFLTNWTCPTGQEISLYNSDEPILIKVKQNIVDTSNSNNPTIYNKREINYQGNIDKVVLFHTSAKEGKINNNPDTSADGNTSAAYPIIAARFADADENSPYGNLEEYNFKTAVSHDQFIQGYGSLKDAYVIYRQGTTPSTSGRKVTSRYVGADVQSCTTDPVSIKYKSTPHAVIAFNHQDYVFNQTHCYKNYTLPVLNKHIETQVGGTTIQGYDGINRYGDTNFTHDLFWDPLCKAVVQNRYVVNSTVEYAPANNGWLYLGEIYRDVDTSTIFGGNSQDALEANQWVIGGPAVKINTDTSTTITWCEGDTYYQRYDCLKTYPFTMEDQNSVVDILSFLCETRINIDGRYDRNRNQASNLYMSPLNFNLLNPAYSQHNNFFQYRTINANKLRLNSYPNTVTWTKTKTLGEEVDTWTNITLASTLDLDGDMGELRALKKFNNDIIAFQDKGISQILYNDNVQIAATTGVPIEIANSGKVSGKRYISNQVGCINKWSICDTPGGLYFVDNIGKDIYLFNGSLQNISDAKGFHSWAIKSFTNTNLWNPMTFNNNITYYDKINGDVFFVTSNDCLAFSDVLGNFSSFYNYEKMLYFSNLSDRAICWRQANSGSNTTSYYPWLHREGEYNKFFDSYKPFGTTVIVNPDPTEDKIFNNVEFRADTFNSSTYLPNDTFDYLRTWNEYQHGTVTLTDIKDKPSSLKKKFRVWRANIPRWNVVINGKMPNYRDRMRNPWLYLSLKKTTPNNYKTVLHDIVVDYFE